MDYQPAEKWRPGRFAWIGLAVFFAGFLLRLYACLSTFVVNPDAAIYIHQARAIFFGQLDKVVTCGTGFVSNYALFIAGAYAVFKDWILAAQAVSLLFGSGVLIAVYSLARRFFDTTISALVMLVFAVMPVFVSRSADAVRGPVYWFFMTWGLYASIRHTEKRGCLYLLLANIFFLMAAWARIEAVLLIILTSVYLLLFQRERPVKKGIVFLLPTIIASIVSFTAMSRFDLPASTLLRVNEIGSKVTAPMLQYQQLREHLKDLAARNRDGLTEHFLPEARNLVWLVALGTLINRVLEAFFYVFLLIFLLGFAGFRKRVREDPRLIYFLLLACGGFILLYAHTLDNWMIYYRFIAIIIYPCTVFCGFGLERIVRFCTSRLHFRVGGIYTAIAVLIVAVTLPKNLDARREDKQVFRQIGEYVALKEGNSREISVLASMDTIRWFSLYANLNYPGVVCPQPYIRFDTIVGKTYPHFVKQLRKRQVKYFLWEEKHWPTKRFNLSKKYHRRHFRELNRWFHPDTGQMILYEVIA